MSVALVAVGDAVGVEHVANVAGPGDALAVLEPTDLGGRALEATGDVVEAHTRALAEAAKLGIETVWADVDEPLPFDDASFDAAVLITPGSDGTARAMLEAMACARPVIGARVGDAFYATCTDDCNDPDHVKVVKLETDGTVANAMIALDATGRPQVLLSTFFDVYYARCTGDCTTRSGWVSQ